MSGRKLTAIVIVAVVVGVIIYDVVAITSYGVESSISRVLYRTASNHPILSFAFGVLCGHLFWAQKVQAK